MEDERWVAGVVETERLVLEPLHPSHADELAPVLDDAELHRFIGGRPAGVEELRLRFERQARGHSEDGRARWLNWVVRERRTSTAAGTLQATVVGDEMAEIAELAWVIGPSHQRRGFATEAAVCVASWLRERGVMCLRAHIHPRNEASNAVARAVGLEPTDLMVHGECRWEWRAP